MKVDKVLKRLAAKPEDAEELRRVARALGSELPRQRLEVLRAFRAGLARQTEPEGTFADGYLNGMLDITAEYEVSLRQVADESERQRLAMRREWREVLLALREGPMLPSEIATVLRRDRPTITRILKKLRIAGLVEAYAQDEVDGRTRPHRLTLHGQRLVDGLDAGVSAELERGIRIAVALFDHLVQHVSSSQSELDVVARAFEGDPGSAAAAVSLWRAEARDAGLLTEFDGEFHLTPGGAAPVGGRSKLFWDHGTALLARLKEQRTTDFPVFVRTTNDTWGPWAFALQNDASGLSRTIVNGDILSRTIEPPPHFDLLYDDPAVIGADREIPAMQSLIQQADARFVVTTGEDSIPEGFVQLELAPGKD
ncbi:helix-turn-helix domain-containing protein [Haliangium sp.]|uniref:helix-turn-helix domain-containing protein n=1 Tax=Haliangium sp. TaxID=2663208 RepID=UPI003D0F7D6D